MSTYRTVGLLAVVAIVAFVSGLKVGQSQRSVIQPPPSQGTEAQNTEPCCNPLPASARNAGPPLKIPTGSGLPCLAEFGSNECAACKKLAPVLDELEAKLKGKLDVVRIDTRQYPEEADRWRLRLIPTIILLDASGKELARREGYLPLDKLLSEIKAAGIKVD